MVFSLFRKTVKAGEPASADAKTPANSSGARRPSERRAAQEAARKTAEKIDQIESEMIADVDNRAEARNESSKPEPLIIKPPHENDEDVRRALAKLRKKARTAKSQGKRKPTAEELLAELTLREATRMGTVADVLAADQQTLLRDPDPETEPETDPGLEFEVSAPLPGGLVGEPGSSGDDADDSLAIDVIDGALPDEMEEAAILYSNGQYEPAAGVLEDMLSRNEHPNFRAMNWFMLFDLHRVTGDRDGFDQLAIAYANEAEKSPPGWSDDLLAPKQADGPKPGASPSTAVFAVAVDQNATKLVDQVVRAAKNKRDCSVDFGEVQTLSPEGAEELIRLFESFGQMSHPLTVTDVDTLLNAAKGQTEVGRVDSTEAFWQLAMTCLRIKGQQSEFDDLSIDYCVTFEISPPPWQPYPGQLTLHTSQDSASEQTDAKVAEPETVAAASDKLTFSGDLCGKIDAQRSSIKALAVTHETILIDCRKLRRIDFVAAGELLNEQLTLQGSNRMLHFYEPNYLVYALMHVMGMQETARITRRLS